MNKDSVVNRNLGCLDPMWDRVLGKYESGQLERRSGRLGQVVRYERRDRLDRIGNEGRMAQASSDGTSLKTIV